MSDSEQDPRDEQEDCMQYFGRDYPDLVAAVTAFENSPRGRTFNVGLYEPNVDFDDALLSSIHDHLGDRLAMYHDDSDVLQCARLILHRECHYERLLGETIYDVLTEAVNEYAAAHIAGKPLDKQELIIEIKDLIKDRIFAGGALPSEWNEPVEGIVNQVYSIVEEDMALEAFNRQGGPNNGQPQPASPLRITEIPETRAFLRLMRSVVDEKKKKKKNTVKTLFSRQKLGRGQKRRRGKTRKRRKKKTKRRKRRSRRS